MWAVPILGDTLCKMHSILVTKCADEKNNACSIKYPNNCVNGFFLNIHSKYRERILRPCDIYKYDKVS